MTEELTPLKGKKHGNCNRTDCQKENSAVWYNHGTSKWYCEECAKWLNEDRFNKADAMSMFGHDLCTHMDDENSPQDHKVLVIGDNHTGSLLAQRMLEQSGGIRNGDMYIVHAESGVGKSKLAEYLLEEHLKKTSDPVLVDDDYVSRLQSFIDQHSRSR